MASTKQALQVLTQPWVWLAAALGLVFAGFWPTFFGRLNETDAAHLIHGFSASAWMIGVVTQAWLMAHRRFSEHRRLGRWIIVLAPVLVLSGFYMIKVMLLKNLDEVRLYRFKFAYLDTVVLVLFLVFVGLAIANILRRNVAVHMRFMACTAILALEPALERLFMALFPVISDFNDALNLALLSVEAILVTLIAMEWHSGRVRAPFPLLLAFFIFLHLTVTPVASNPEFQSFAMQLAKL